MSEPTESSTASTEDTIEESTVSPVAEEPGKKIHTGGSTKEKAKGHEDVRDLSKETVKTGKESPKKGTETPLLKHVRSSSTTVSIIANNMQEHPVYPVAQVDGP